MEKTTKAYVLEGESGNYFIAARAFVVAVVLFGEAIAGAAPIVLPLPPWSRYNKITIALTPLSACSCHLLLQVYNRSCPEVDKR